MRRSTKRLNHRYLAPFLSAALGLSLSACGEAAEADEDKDEKSQSTSSESDTESNRSDAEDKSTGADTASSSEDTDSNTDSGSSGSSSDDTTTTQEPPKPTLNLGYRSIDEGLVLLTWSTPSDYAFEKVSFLIGRSKDVQVAPMFGESVLLSTEDEDEPLKLNVSMYEQGKGAVLAEVIEIPLDHGKDHPDFGTVVRPRVVNSVVGVQSMTLNLSAGDYRAYADEPVTYHIYLDGKEQTKALSGKDVLEAGNHLVTGLYPDRSYNFQIQSSASPADKQVASQVLSVQTAQLPAKEFQIPVGTNQDVSIHETNGVRMPDFVRASDMELSIYVDGKKLADDCKVESGPAYITVPELSIAKTPPALYVGIKDSCYVATKGAEHKVVFEAKVTLEATGETFVTKSSNTNIIHNPA